LAQTFCCKIRKVALKYLGIPSHFRKLKKEDLQSVIDKIIKRAGGWRGRLLSFAAMVQLVKSCLASIQIYLLSLLKFPAWAIKIINSQMAHYLWENYEVHHKSHLANMDLVTLKK
jgi:hypothetical protein